MEAIEFYIKGVKFHDLPKIINDLSEGDLLDLIPEPDNKFDANAVRIESEGTMCGFVPKKFSAAVSAAIEADGADRVTCEVIEVNAYAPTWEMCKVKISDHSEDDVDYGDEIAY